MAAEPGNAGFQELYSLLVPLAGGRLIVPRVCVAEVTGVGQMRLSEGDPDWLVGTVSWKGREVPLVSFEASCGQSVPEIGNRARAVIFYASARIHGGYFAVMSQGLPQLVRLNEDVLSTDPDAPDFGETPVICRVRMLNETPLVPDLERLEHRIADLLEAEAAQV
jgi:chemosensory pili system protein ChpC